MRKFYTLLSREVRSYFYSPIAYIVLVFFLFGVGPFFGLPAIARTKRTIQLVDLAYSARPLAR